MYMHVLYTYGYELSARLYCVNACCKVSVCKFASMQCMRVCLISGMHTCHKSARMAVCASTSEHVHINTEGSSGPCSKYDLMSQQLLGAL